MIADYRPNRATGPRECPTTLYIALLDLLGAGERGDVCRSWRKSLKQAARIDRARSRRLRKAP